jgi:hypothetical protein
MEFVHKAAQRRGMIQRMLQNLLHNVARHPLAIQKEASRAEPRSRREEFKLCVSARLRETSSSVP